MSIINRKINLLCNFLLLINTIFFVFDHPLYAVLSGNNSAGPGQSYDVIVSTQGAQILPENGDPQYGHMIVNNDGTLVKHLYPGQRPDQERASPETIAMYGRINHAIVETHGSNGLQTLEGRNMVGVYSTSPTKSPINPEDFANNVVNELQKHGGASQIVLNGCRASATTQCPPNADADSRSQLEHFASAAAQQARPGQQMVVVGSTSINHTPITTHLNDAEVEKSFPQLSEEAKAQFRKDVMRLHPNEFNKKYGAMEQSQFVKSSLVRGVAIAADGKRVDQSELARGFRIEGKEDGATVTPVRAQGDSLVETGKVLHIRHGQIFPRSPAGGEPPKGEFTGGSPEYAKWKQSQQQHPVDPETSQRPQPPGHDPLRDDVTGHVGSKIPHPVDPETSQRPQPPGHDPLPLRDDVSNYSRMITGHVGSKIPHPVDPETSQQQHPVDPETSQRPRPQPPGHGAPLQGATADANPPSNPSPPKPKKLLNLFQRRKVNPH